MGGKRIPIQYPNTSSSNDTPPHLSPFYDRVTITLPGKPNPLIITSNGASTTKPYVASLKINGQATDTPIILHDQIVNGGEIEFVMSDKPTSWASETLVGCVFRVQV